MHDRERNADPLRYGLERRISSDIATEGLVTDPSAAIDGDLGVPGGTERTADGAERGTRFAQRPSDPRLKALAVEM